MDAKSLGSRISSHRRVLGMTQATLAQMLGVSDKAVSRWERGVGFPDVTLLEPLATALQIDLSELVIGPCEVGACTEDAHTETADAEESNDKGASVEEISKDTPLNQPYVDRVTQSGIALRTDRLSKTSTAPEKRPTLGKRRRLVKAAAYTAAATFTALIAASAAISLRSPSEENVITSNTTAGGFINSEGHDGVPSANTSSSNNSNDKYVSEEDGELAREQQEWRVANHIDTSEDLEWDAVTRDGITAFAAEVKVRNVCQTSCDKTFDPDLVSGITKLRLSEDKAQLQIEIQGTYIDGSHGTCTAIVVGNEAEPYVQELQIRHV